MGSPSPLSRIDGMDSAPTRSFGLFAGVDTVSSGFLGWYWVVRDLRWREALLLQPPAALHTSLRVPPEGGRVVLFLTLPRQEVVGGGRSVGVLLTATDRVGRTLARRECVVRIGGGGVGSSPWQHLTLDLSAARGQEVDLVLAAETLKPDINPDEAPILAVSARFQRSLPSSAGGGLNCLIVLVDALRADRLHCYGFPEPTSPRIDSLAEEGVLFERVQSAASWTVPSVASLFTGTYPATHGMIGFSIPGRLELATLATWLHRAGVRTAAVSANRLVTPAAGFGAGFDLFIGSPHFDGRHSPRADWVTDQALSLLRRLRNHRFFLYLHYMDPHGDYEPPPEWARFGWTGERQYLGEILYCDSQIARLLRGLDEMGLTKRTLVAFLADHGEAFLEHGATDHGSTLHVEEVEVPLILRLPGRIPAGRRVATQVRSIDLTPTILELMGLEVPRQVEGESLTGFWSEGGSPTDREAFSETAAPGSVRGQSRLVAFHDGRFKLILDRRLERTLLYDTLTDHPERNDLSARMPRRVGRMRRRIYRYLLRRKPSVKKRHRQPTPDEKAILRNLGYLAPGRKEGRGTARSRTPHQPKPKPPRPSGG